MGEQDAIGKAWEAVAEAMEGEGSLDMDDYVDATLDAVRAFGLAVLDAVEATEGEGFNEGWRLSECDFDAVRARLEELGRVTPRAE